MNNTLTGLGLALVLALVAALIGPWFVNWTAYREDFAAQASALIGAPVKVTGAVDARLLPTPYVRFHGLTAGTGATALSVDEVEVELAIAPLMRGAFKAERVKLVRPKLGVEAMPDGSVRTAFSNRKQSGASDRVSLDDVEISDGAVIATTPAGRYAVERISGVAEAGSFAGPYKFEGASGPEGARVQARLSTTRIDDKGAMRLKIALQRDGRPETLEADGSLTVGAKPSFDGRVTANRPASRATDQWRAAAALKADAGRAQVSSLDLVYGPDERALRLGGRGEATLGAKPRFDLALESRQVDLDRFLGEGRPKTPSGVIAALTDRFRGTIAPPCDGRLSLDLRGVVLAGDVVQNLTAELASETGAWRVRNASATLPGGARLAATGALAFSGSDPGFAGDVDFSTADLAGLRRWLAGGQDVAGPVRTLSVRGHASAGLGSVAIDGATLAVDGARSTGRISWKVGNDPERDRLEAALVSDNLDLDALGAERLLRSALSDGGLDVVLALDAKTLTFAGVRMSDVSIEGSSVNGGLDLTRFDIRDAGGATLAGAGRIVRGAGGPEGSVSFDVASDRLAPLIALARAGGVPEPVLAALEARAGPLAPLKLKIDIEADGSGERLTATGDAAGGRLDARVSTQQLSIDAPAEIEAKVVSPDGARLAALAGLGVSPAVSAQGGEISLKLSGALSKGMAGEGRFLALGVDLAAKGAVALAPDVGLSAEGTATLSSAEIAAFGEAIGRLTPGASPKAPVQLAAKVALGPEGARIDDLDGKVAGVAVKGRLATSYDGSRPFEGELEVDELPASAIAALALSPAAFAGATDGRSVWPSAPFGPAPGRGLAGRLDVSAARMPLAGAETATDARFALAFRPSGIAVEGFTGTLDGGRLAGSANLARSGDDATVALVLTLDGLAVDRLAALAPAGSAVAGTADFKLEAQASGRSPSALMGAFTGAGTATIRDARIRRLDVSAIDRIEPKVEAGLTLDAPKVAEALDRDLAGADLAFDQAVAPFTLSAGVLRAGGLDARNGEARLGGVATFDLRRLTLDADLTLQPNRPDAPQISVSFEGPLSAPRRRIDATGFTGWLSVRAVERETKRIDAMEADMQERARLARLRAEEEKKRADEDKKRLEEERRKVDLERRKREAEVRALTESLPKPAAPSSSPGLPPALDLSAPGVSQTPGRQVSPPTGVFAPQGRAGARSQTPDGVGAPQSILPPGAAAPGR